VNELEDYQSFNAAMTRRVIAKLLDTPDYKMHTSTLLQIIRRDVFESILDTLTAAGITRRIESTKTIALEESFIKAYRDKSKS
jgi:hypothetical protein